MPYKFATVDRVFIARTEGQLTISEFRQMYDDLSRHHQRMNTELFYIAIVPPGTPSLSSEVRAELTKMLPGVLEKCHCFYNVVEGTGFWASIMRSMFAGLMLATGKRAKVVVLSTLSEAVGQIARELDTDAGPLLRRIETTGITQPITAAPTTAR